MLKQSLFSILFLMHTSLVCASEQESVLYHFDQTTVYKGKQQARVLGLPTANVYPPKLSLSSGTYAGFVSIGSETLRRKALFYVPSTPEVGLDSDRFNLLEAHVIGLDFETDLYGQRLAGTVLIHISNPVAWTTMEAMKEKFRVEKLACLKALEAFSFDDEEKSS